MEWKNLKEALEAYGQVLEEQYRQEIANTGAFASGRLFDSVHYVVEVNNSTIDLCLSLEDYWKWVEDGRGPGKFPPLDKIEQWISIKPVAPYPDARGKVPSNKQLAFLIGRKIAEEGTEGKHILENAMENTQDWIDLIEDAIGKDIEREIDSFLRKL
jgi:hypothetical protein